MGAGDASQQMSAVFTGPGAVELRAESLPEPGPGQVLVRLRACGVCTSDRRLFSGQQSGYPIVPGHEPAGEIAGLGPDASPALAVGQRVALALMERCFGCFYCRRGQSQLCRSRHLTRRPGRLTRIGGFARYLIAEDWMVFPMPDDLPFERIALAEPLACVVHSVNQADVRLSDDVLVLGGGTMGQLHGLVARLRGARVFLSEPDPDKREAAAAAAHEVFDPRAVDLAEAMHARTQGRGVDVVFLTVGTPQTAEQAAQAVRQGGKVILYGSFPKGSALTLDPSAVHRKEIVWAGVANQDLRDWHEATRLIAHGLLDLGYLISATYPLERIHDALRFAVQGAGFRTVVNM